MIDYPNWAATCDTLHGYTQILGKLAVKLAAPQPQLQHAALQLTVRGWETPVLPAPDGSGVFGVLLDLRSHQAVVEHSSGALAAFPLTPGRSVADVTAAILDRVGSFAGQVQIDTTAQEVPWSVPLDKDHEHATYDVAAVERYFDAATRAATALAIYRAPYRGRSTPVNAWWGSFDLAVSLFSGAAANPSSEGFIERNAMDAQEVAVGWWPGDARYPRAAFYAYAHPAPAGYSAAQLSPAAWHDDLGEYVLPWSDVEASDDPQRTSLEFLRGALRYSCGACEWDPTLTDSAFGTPPPVR
ncbi:hypothetical protein SAMN05445060_2347 [Williamsia sterculiae]|uniref:Uncharacterized protein n=2 Tax=Williamsia sterculiae TaxID=1344003 RepID=A0A1N7FW96_9NOCA|nr:hypothetical protein SAMN05445060_2347 [Williamsia sterculiae]